MHARGKDYPPNWWKALGGLLIAHGTTMKSIINQLSLVSIKTTCSVGELCLVHVFLHFRENIIRLYLVLLDLGECYLQSRICVPKYTEHPLVSCFFPREQTIAVLVSPMSHWRKLMKFLRRFRSFAMFQSIAKCVVVNYQIYFSVGLSSCRNISARLFILQVVVIVTLLLGTLSKHHSSGARTKHFWHLYNCCFYLFSFYFGAGYLKETANDGYRLIRCMRIYFSLVYASDAPDSFSLVPLHCTVFKK